jgi:O-antigen/teichoic acid export membrane protein
VGDNPSAQPSKHYSAAAIRRSFVHFLFGKGVSAIATLLVLFVLVRQLSTSEFATYTSLHALTLIIGLVSSFGIPQLLHRFLPELRTGQKNRAMYRLLCGGIVIRAMLYAALCLLIMPVLDVVASTFKLQDWLDWMPWYFVVGFIRVNTTFIAQAVESLLWQREAQYSLAFGGLLKLAGTLYVVTTGSMSLPDFIVIECVAEAAAMLMLTMVVIYRWRQDDERLSGGTGVLKRDSRRYIRFASWCYLQNLTSVFYGSAANRLFVAYFMSAEFIAIFGVIDRLIDFVRRYEPLRMFVGLVRPVLMSRFSQSKDFGKLVRLANVVLQANFILLFAPLALLLVVGDPFLGWVTEGKFGDITALLGAFYVVLLFTSVSNLLDLLVKAVEHNRVYMFSNVLLSGSLLVAIPTIEYFGLWSIALANLAGVLMALTVINFYLRRRGYRYQPEWQQIGLVIAFSLLAAATGWLALIFALPAIVAGAVTVATYALLVLWRIPIKREDQAVVAEILPRCFRVFLRVDGAT